MSVSIIKLSTYLNLLAQIRIEIAAYIGGNECDHAVQFDDVDYIDVMNVEKPGWDKLVRTLWHRFHTPGSYVETCRAITFMEDKLVKKMFLKAAGNGFQKREVRMIIRHLTRLNRTGGSIDGRDFWKCCQMDNGELLRKMACFWSADSTICAEILRQRLVSIEKKKMEEAS